jgi:mannitol 2-dehydrogenase
MKIRILNGGHAIIAYPGGLLDIDLVHEAMAHPLIAGFLDKVERDEIIPLVPPVPGTDLNAYFGLIHSRFANPEIADTVRRLCLDGSNRQPKFILPSLRDNLAAGRMPPGLILECALWCRYCAGISDSGAVIAPNDPNWDRLTGVAQAARDEPALWLAMDDIYGAVGRDPAVIAEFTRALNALWEKGTVAVLADYLNA